MPRLTPYLLMLLAAGSGCGAPDSPSPDGGAPVDSGTQSQEDAGTDAGQSVLASCQGPTGGSFTDWCSYTWLCTGGERTINCTRRDGGEDCTCSVANDAGTPFPAPAPATFCSKSFEPDFKSRIVQACHW